MKLPLENSFALRLAGASLVYALLALVSLYHFSPQGVISVFWPASGWALALMLIGGRRYVWSSTAGILIAHAFWGTPVWVALGAALGAFAGLLLAQRLLASDPDFDTRLPHLRSYRALIFKGIIPASLVNGLIGLSAMTAAGAYGWSDFPVNFLFGWMGESLGLLLVTPLTLICHRTSAKIRLDRHLLESGLLIGLAFVLGQVLFNDSIQAAISDSPLKAYWLFPLIAWAAIRLDRRTSLIMLGIIAVQTMASVSRNQGYFVGPDVQTRALDAWSYLIILTLFGISLATLMRSRRRYEADLRIAAIAFECQEGMIVTDPGHVILRANQSFSRIMGYSSEEVIGKNTSLMRSDRHPDAYCEAIWEESRLTGTSANEVWHRRKNGEVFPQWLTSTAVKDANGRVVNYVVTHTDITFQKQQEARRLAEEAAHRDTLVREVHHRIKNNLQGITGMLHLLAQERPEVADPLNQAIAQVRSIAVIHGLQGRANVSQVRVCELTNAIAADIKELWKAPIHVDIPSIWTPVVVAESEAVPIALILNELIINAVKHGGKTHGEVDIKLRKGSHEESIHVSITNPGQWRSQIGRSDTTNHSGLKLIDALLPPMGARLEKEQMKNKVMTRLELEPPVIRLENKAST